MILLVFINILLIIALQMMEIPLVLKFLFTAVILIHLYRVFLRSTEDLK